mgnify:CR=1 FL=1
MAHIERMHAKNRHSFASHLQYRRSAEGAIYKSFLTKLMFDHVARGRRNFSLLRSVAEYAKSHLGLRTSASFRRVWDKRRGRRVIKRTKKKEYSKSGIVGAGRVKLLYINLQARLAGAARGHRSQTRQEEKEAWKAFAAQFDGISVDEKHTWMESHAPLDFFRHGLPQDDGCSNSGDKDPLDTLEWGDADTSWKTEGTSRDVLGIDIGDDNLCSGSR